MARITRSRTRSRSRKRLSPQSPEATAKIPSGRKAKAKVARSKATDVTDRGTMIKELLQRRYPITFIMDAVISAAVATYLIHQAPVQGNLLFAVGAGFAEAKLGLIAHEASHGGAPRWLGWLYDCAMGSRSQWIVKHNHGHHLVTNTLKDPDIQISPIMRIHPKQPLKSYMRFQHFYQFPLFMAISIGLRLQGIIYLHTTKGMGEILFHWLLATPATYFYIVRPYMMLGTPGLIYFLVENFTVGLIYGCLFSVSHVNQMVKFDPEGKTLRDRQLATTADWAVGSHAINYLTGGLNHQVVHHLYPNVPSYAYPEIAKLLKEEFGDLYNDMGWSFIHALRSNTMYLSSMGSKQL